MTYQPYNLNSSKQLIPRSILLLGPTGSGKTPLGEYAEKHGVQKKSCSHFDFGDNLRRIDAGTLIIPELNKADIALIHHLLHDAALLEDRDFHIAAKILQHHIRLNAQNGDTIIILNGLPRHTGQAHNIAKIVNITRVIHLDCHPETILHRISNNSGGDRNQRTDDAPRLVAQKIATFNARTAPLLQYYHQHLIPITTIRITPDSTPAIVWNQANHN